MLNSFGGLGRLGTNKFGGRAPLIAPGVLRLDRLAFSRAQPASSISTAFASDGSTLDQYTADVPRFNGAARGLLLEGQRSNLLLNSAVLSTQSATLTAVAHCLHFTGTGTVTLSGAATGTLNGTGADNRVALTFTPSAGSVTFTVSGSVTLAQLEVGAFASTYVPTAGAAATRGVDILMASGAQFTSLFPSGVGTILGSFLLPTLSAPGVPAQTLFGIDAGATLNQYTIYNTSGPFIQMLRTTGGVGGFVNITNALTANTLFRVGFIFNSDGSAVGNFNGGSNQILTGGPLGMTTLRIGQNVGGVPMFGEVRHFEALPYAIPAAALPAAVAALPT